jgi:hypothetical protein
MIAVVCPRTSCLVNLPRWVLENSTLLWTAPCSSPWWRITRREWEPQLLATTWTMAQLLPTTWARLLTRTVLAWVATRLHSRLLPMLVETTKVASLSTEAATATEASAPTLAAEAQATLLCLLASRVRVPHLQATLQHRQVIRQPLQASAVPASVLHLPPLARPALNTLPPRRVCLPRRQATTRPRRQVTHQRHHATRRPPRHSLRRRLHTAQHHQRIWEQRRRTTALHRHVSVQRRHSTVRQARSSTLQASDAPLLHQRRPLLARQARRTRLPALLATHSTRPRRLGTLLRLRARRRTTQIRGGRLLAQRTRLRKFPLVIVVSHSSATQILTPTQVSQTELEYHAHATSVHMELDCKLRFLPCFV